MNLLIDIGNTSLHWALQEGTDLGPMQAVRHGGAVPLDLLAAWEGLDPPRRVLVGNVGGGQVGQAVARVARALWGLECAFAATRGEYLGVRVAYPEPDRLGVDRWLALLGAQGQRQVPAVIVDAGTAVTFDLLLADGEHLGGLILPGIAMMRESLLGGTRIPRVEPAVTDAPWATDTGSAMAAGSLHALAALAERLYDRLRARLDERAGGPSAAQPMLLVTGGDGPRLLPLIDRPCTLIPDLVLRGLARLTAGAH